MIYLQINHLYYFERLYVLFSVLFCAMLLSESPTIISNRAETFTGPTILIQLSLNDFQIWINLSRDLHYHVIFMNVQYYPKKLEKLQKRKQSSDSLIKFRSLFQCSLSILEYPFKQWHSRDQIYNLYHYISSILPR